MIREVIKDDLKEILHLYLYLHEKSVPELTERLMYTWNQILEDENYHLIVNIVGDKIISSCTCIIIPNLTRNGRSYALVENVVTHIDYRGKGYATECLNYVKEIAIKQNCYKIMLFTSLNDEKTLGFYRNAGYNAIDKTAFIQWLNI
ncbi:GNAT family N-acetyltransferase [Thomasclavelia sp.]